MNCVNAEILCQSIDENDFFGHLYLVQLLL